MKAISGPQMTWLIHALREFGDLNLLPQQMLQQLVDRLNDRYNALFQPNDLLEIARKLCNGYMSP
jgi:hypothetical protein